MADVEKTAASTEETTKVVQESPKKVENGTVKEDIKEGKETTEGNGTSGDKEENGAANGKGSNGAAKESNGAAKESNGAKKDENGHSNGHTEKEAVKRKAEEGGDTKEEPIPVSAEKIAKLKEGETEKSDAAEETSA